MFESKWVRQISTNLITSIIYITWTTEDSQNCDDYRN